MRYIIALFLIVTVISAQEKEEFRGVKITDVDSRVLYSDQNISDAMDYLASININAILVVVLNGGYTQYPSAVMDSLFEGKMIDPDFEGRDPLERIIIEAHRNGIEVYPWFEYGFASYYSGGTPPIGGHILNKYPDWALRTKDGSICTKNGFDWMSAINPDVQNFINSLVKEVITNYDVDGVEFSDRIPAMPIEGGYDSVTVEIYKSEHNGNEPPSNYNNTAWKRWRADKLNDWYHEIRGIIKDYDENLFVASSPSIYPWGYDNYLQDAQTWIDEGVADHFIPQLYRYSYNEYMYEFYKALDQVGNKKEILFPGFLLNIGTGSNLYVMSSDYLLNAIQSNRENGVNGEVYFFYEGFRKNNNQIGDTLKATFYKEPAKVPLRNGNVWRPKAEIVNEDGNNTNLKGNWSEYPMPGYEGKIVRTNDIESYSSITYAFDIKSSAYYDLYTYMVPNTNLTKNAVYNIISESDTSEIIVDQSKMNKKGWQKLKTVFLEKGKHEVLSIDNTLLSEDEYLAADASMIMINRKLSPDVVITDIKDKHEISDVPKEISLEQNYPNPFNPQTSIGFSIPRSGKLKLKVYDILGREVLTLVDGYKSAGNHKVKFNASNLTSGVYIYQIQFNDRFESKKMILIK